MSLIDRIASVLGYQKAVQYAEPSILSTMARGSASSPRPTQATLPDYLGRYADEAWVYSSVRIIQTKGAEVPLRVYKVVDGKEQVQAEHPLQKLLDEVNPFMDGYGLREATHGYKELTGNAIWLLDRMVNGKPTEIYPLNPAHIKPLVDKKSGVIGYEFRINGQLISTFKPEEIIHFRYWNPLDPWWGQAPISAGRDGADMIKRADLYNIAFFENSAEAGGFLTTDKTLAEDQVARIKQAWAKNHQGQRKAHKVEILFGGLDWKANTASHADMMFPELKRMSREDVLSCYMIPPVMAGIFDEANYSNADVQERIFWKTGMKPRFRSIDSVLTERLGKPYGDLIIKHDLTGVTELQEDQKLKAERDEVHTRSGIKTINEVRTEMGLKPVPWGDTWNAPIGLLPIEAHAEPIDPEPESEPEPEPEDDKSLSKPIERVVELVAQVEKALDDLPPPEDPQKLRRDKIWATFKVQTESLERRWYPTLRRLFSSQEKEVISNMRNQDWEASSRQIRMDNMTTFRTKIQVILFDKAHARKVFRKEGRALMEFVLGQKAKDEIKDYELAIDFNLSDPRVVSWLSTKAFKFADEINTTTEEALRKTLEEGVKAGEAIADIEKRIADVFDIARGSRTQMIARTEVISASNKGAFEAYRQSRVVKGVEWISSRDERVRDLHDIDGEVVDLDARFSNGLKFPGDPDGSAENVINCRCTTAPVTKEIE